NQWGEKVPRGPGRTVLMRYSRALFDNSSSAECEFARVPKAARVRKRACHGRKDAKRGIGMSAKRCQEGDWNECESERTRTRPLAIGQEIDCRGTSGARFHSGHSAEWQHLGDEEVGLAILEHRPAERRL